MLVVKLICKECYNKKYGEPPIRSLSYKITDEKMECEDCGKKDYLIYTTTPVNPKNYKLKLKLKSSEKSKKHKML
ncbi:MAG: hypothetical protein ACI4F7_03005 [Acutalibacteraceae bacterium]